MRTAITAPNAHSSAHILRAGIIALVVHTVVAVFSLAGSYALFNFSGLPDWNYSTLSYYLGIINVVSGIAAALFLMAAYEGWTNTARLFALCVLIAGGAELLGTTTGFPFGSYTYTERLGPKILGHVPYLIPPSWFMVLYPAMAIASCFSLPLIARASIAGGLLTLWDVAMDPAVTTGFAYWTWKTNGGFYGMPLTNWLGWWLTGSLIALIFWRSQPHVRLHMHPWAWALYLIQGGFMALLAVVYERPLAALFWLVGIIVMWFFIKRAKSWKGSLEARADG